MFKVIRVMGSQISKSMKATLKNLAFWWLELYRAALKCASLYHRSVIIFIFVDSFRTHINIHSVSFLFKISSPYRGQSVLYFMTVPLL